MSGLPGGIEHRTHPVILDFETLQLRRLAVPLGVAFRLSALGQAAATPLPRRKVIAAGSNVPGAARYRSQGKVWTRRVAGIQATSPFAGFDAS